MTIRTQLTHLLRQILGPFDSVIAGSMVLALVLSGLVGIEPSDPLSAQLLRSPLRLLRLGHPTEYPQPNRLALRGGSPLAAMYGRKQPAPNVRYG